MVFFLFLVSVSVLRRIISVEKLSPVEASQDVALPTVALPSVASPSLGGDLSQLSSVLSQWGEGAATPKESRVSKDSVAAPAKD